ncbi:hypothetical protein [Streptomyces sp. ODS28]|uniref:hypothetical protein n=1 Tax=Streptomyces sp. ODS28 TaxID=3136688 RepID=UPI0031E83547
MTVDPTDPDTFEDVYEEEPDAVADPEAPAEDAAEQQTGLLRQHEHPITGRGADREVDPADAADQEREVELEEDEYR